jgi:hypothetical protein
LKREVCVPEAIWKKEIGCFALSPPGPPEGQPDRKPPGSAGNAAAFFVWCVWALMLSAALAGVGTFCSRVPFWDDWTLVPAVTGDRAISLSWLWEQHNEHRVPLPKLLLVELYRLTGYDFRAGVFVNVLALAGLAALLIRTTQLVRGRPEFSDAFFPLVLLHWGQYECLFISFTVNLVLPTVLVGLLLAVLVRSQDGLTPPAGVLSGVVLILLPLCGGSGVALVPALALWLAWAGVRFWQRTDGARRWGGALFIGLASAALLLVAAYLRGYQRPYFCYDPALAGLRAQVRTAVQVLATSFGAAAWHLWPISGVVAVGLSIITLALVGRAWWGRPAERFRALGLLLFLAAVFCLILVVGWGRSVQGHRAGFQSRFATLAVPLLLGAYVILDLYGPTAGWGRAILFSVACLALPFNTYEGVNYARDYQRSMREFERDLRAGEPTYLLLKRHAPFLFFSQNEELGRALKMLRDAGAEPFPCLGANPPFREVLLDLVPAALDHMTWEGRTAHGTGADPNVVFRLPQQQFVAGVRIRYAYPGTERRPLYFQLFWGNGDRGFDDRDRYLNFLLERSDEDREVTVWIGDRIDRVCVHPDNDGGAFTIREMVLLVPSRGTGS